MKRVSSGIAYLVLVALGLMILGGIGSAVDTWNNGVDTVTVRGPDWDNGRTPMFYNLNAGIDAGFHTLSAGTRCTKASSTLYAYRDGGPPLLFWRLRCDDKVGFVNADYVH